MARCTVSRAILARCLSTPFTCALYKGRAPCFFYFASPLRPSLLSLALPRFLRPLCSCPPPHTFFFIFQSNPRSFLHKYSTLSAGPAYRMPSVNPPYPSFTLVMSSSTGNSADTSRLPAYRASHSGRYHPYSRAHPSHHENHMVRACDSISPRVLLRHWTLIRVCVQSADN